MVEKRMGDISRMLLAAAGPLKIDTIAERLQVSNKTIRNDLSAVTQLMAKHGLQLEKKPGRGVFVAGTTADKLTLVERLRHLPRSLAPDSPQGRQSYIIKRLLLNGKQMTMQELADELFVSRVTIHKDMTAVEKWLNHYSLLLLSRPNYGVQIEGGEENWRHAVAGLLAELKESGELRKILEQENLGRVDHKTLLKLKSLVELDYGKLERIVCQAEETTGISFSDEAYTGLIIHIAIAIQRLRQNKDINMPESLLESLRQKPEYPVAKQIADGIETVFSVRVPDSEVGYILLHIVGAKRLQNQTDIVALELEAEDSLAVAMAKEIILIAQGVLGIALEEDRQLLNGLVLHLRPTINRVRYGMSLKNPILEEIKETYPDMYGVAWMASRVFDKHLGKRIGDEEIGYIALHIGAAVERNKRLIRVVVVCGSGIGTSQMLAARLNRYFRELEISRVISLSELEREDQMEAELIITTIPLEMLTPAKPVVHISPLLTRADMQRLEAVITELTKGKDKEKTGGIAMLINKELMVLELDAVNKETAIAQLAEVAWQAGRVTSASCYEMDVLKREQSFSTGIGNGIAIPHGKSAAVKQATIIFGRSKHGIEWGAHDGKPVHMIFMLGVPEDNVDNVHLRILSKLSVCLMEEGFVEELRAAKTAEEIMKKLQTVEEE